MKREWVSVAVLCICGCLCSSFCVHAATDYTNSNEIDTGTAVTYNGDFDVFTKGSVSEFDTRLQMAEGVKDEKVANILLLGDTIKCLRYSLDAKYDVVDYWLRRMFNNYTRSALSSYVAEGVTDEELTYNAGKLVLQLNKSSIGNASYATKLKLISEYRTKWILYSVSVEDNKPMFSFKYGGDELLESILKSKPPYVSDYEVQSFLKDFGVHNEEVTNGIHDILRKYEKANVDLTMLNLGKPFPHADLNKIMSSPFGAREGLFLKALNNHTGVDFAMPFGTNIVSVADGTVLSVKDMPYGYGRYLIIDHGDFFSLYGHCSEILVKEGDAIKKGCKIARVGSSGWSTGNHLHLEIFVNGKCIDPMLCYDKGVEEYEKGNSAGHDNLIVIGGNK